MGEAVGLTEGTGEGAVVGGAIGLTVGATEGLEVVVGLRVGSGDGRFGVANDGCIEGTPASEGEVVGVRVGMTVTAESTCNFLVTPSGLLRSVVCCLLGSTLARATAANDVDMAATTCTLTGILLVDLVPNCSNGDVIEAEFG